MRRTTTLWFVIGLPLLALLFAGAYAWASITYSNSITYASISGTPASPVTNNGSGVLVGTFTTPVQYISVQHGALATTTDFTNYTQVSFDNTTWTTIQTNTPSVTNAGAIDAIVITGQRLPIYCRTVVVATNTISVGAQQTLGATGF